MAAENGSAKAARHAGQARDFSDGDRAGVTAHDSDTGRRLPAGRRSRLAAKRPHRVEFTMSAAEYDDLRDAAARVGLAAGAYAAEAALAAARGVMSPADSPLRQALGEFIRAAGLVRRIGVNLNQAVARLNATGQHGGELLPYAEACVRRADRLDAAAEEIRRRLR